MCGLPGERHAPAVRKASAGLHMVLEASAKQGFAPHWNRGHPSTRSLAAQLPFCAPPPALWPPCRTFANSESAPYAACFLHKGRLPLFILFFPARPAPGCAYLSFLVGLGASVLSRSAASPQAGPSAAILPPQRQSGGFPANRAPSSLPGRCRFSPDPQNRL